MKARQRRLVSFGGSAVAVEYSGARIAAIVDFVFRHAPAQGDAPPHLTFRAMPTKRPGEVALYRGDTLIYQGDSEATWAELLMGEACHNLADRSQGGLLFHAAGLAWRGKGVLLPGGIGAGKSTLAAWLATRGLDYLSDELVFVPHGADTMQTFVRPLNLKSPSRAVLRDYLDPDTAHVLSSSQATLISPRAFRPTVAPGALPLGLILFPRYQPGSDFVLRLLSKAQGGLALMECLVNARNLADHGLSEIARLAQVAPAYRMRYAHFDQIGESLEALKPDQGGER
jgi:hypothetical protein